MCFPCSTGTRDCWERPKGAAGTTWKKQEGEGLPKPTGPKRRERQAAHEAQSLQRSRPRNLIKGFVESY